MTPRLAVTLVALATAGGAATHSGAQEAVNLSAELPKSLPRIGSWERITGSVELDGPRRTIDYAFYVDPTRQALYAVTHYRIKILDMQDRKRSGVSASERLQWHVRMGVFRRFECLRKSPPAPHPCSWGELAPETPAYQNQLPLLLEIYEIHRRLLWARARGLAEHPP